MEIGFQSEEKRSRTPLVDVRIKLRQRKRKERGEGRGKKEQDCFEEQRRRYMVEE